jgi:hypothetical protein
VSQYVIVPEMSLTAFGLLDESPSDPPQAVAVSAMTLTAAAIDMPRRI